MGFFKKKNNSNLDVIEEENVVIEGDRSGVDVGNNRKLPVKNILVIVFMIIFAGVALFSIFYAKLSSSKLEVQYEVDQASVEQYNKDAKDNFDIIKYKEEQEALEKARLLAEQKAKDDAERARLLAEQNKKSEDSIDDNNSDSGAVKSDNLNKNRVKPVNDRLYQGSILLPEANIASKKPSKQSEEPRGNSANNSYGSGGDFLAGTSFANGTVSRIINRDFLLSSGTVLNCVLRTKVITTYEGLVSCQLSKDIYSDNGKNLLVRAGAILEGTQTKVMMQGQGRVFIQWGTIRDNDLIVRIDALGTDMLGASGVPAWVDNHFWKRFGNALLLTFIEDSLAIAQTHANKALSADNITMDSFGNQGSRMAEMALENSINIPPTAYINQGEVINVIIPRNVDFSEVFKNVNF